MGARRRSWARLARVLVVALVLGCLAVPASAAPEDDLAAAQERANQAAAELAEAQDGDGPGPGRRRHRPDPGGTVEARVDGTRAQVRDLAIRLYVEGTTPMHPHPAHGRRQRRHPGPAVQPRGRRGVDGRPASSTGSDREDLRRELAALEEQQEAHAESVEAHRARQADVIEELDRLSEVVAEATAAREAERQEAERRAAAAAGASAESSSAGQSTAGPLDRDPDPADPDRGRLAGDHRPPTTTPPDDDADDDADAVDPAGGRLDVPRPGTARLQQRLRRPPGRGLQPPGQRHPRPPGDAGGGQRRRRGPAPGGRGQRPGLLPRRRRRQRVLRRPPRLVRRQRAGHRGDRGRPRWATPATRPAPLPTSTSRSTPAAAATRTRTRP